MIRIVRSPEPRKLAAVRRRELARIRAAIHAAPQTKLEFSESYSEFRAQLLLTLYKRHVLLEVRPKVERFRSALSGRQARHKDRAWEQLTAELLDPRRQLTALSYDALDQLVPASERKRWGLRLPRP